MIEWVLAASMGGVLFGAGWLAGRRNVARCTAGVALEQMQDNFIATVSHELRTPLTSINGSLALLTAGLLERQPERAERMLRIAAANADRLSRLVDDLLDVERLATGRAMLEVDACSPVALVDGAVNALREVAEGKSIRLLVEGSVEPTLELRADAARLEQVLRHLIDNAVKLSSAGSTVRVAVAASDKDARFSVRDEGQGVPPDKAEMIFERFQRLDTSDARATGGTGLGLAISKGIVEAHGGLIGKESPGLGAGSTFWFVIPRA